MGFLGRGGGIKSQQIGKKSLVQALQACNLCERIPLTHKMPKYVSAAYNASVILTLLNGMELCFDVCPDLSQRKNM